MILPLGDTPNPRGIPFVTYGLMAVNIAAYVLVAIPLSSTPADPRDPLFAEYVRAISEAIGDAANARQLITTTSAYDLFIFQYCFRPAAPGFLALFTSMFLHAGFVHLFGNMLFLWIYGDNVEHRLGPGRYLVAYLLAGVAATLFHLAYSADSPLPVLGASGAISGVLGFYFVWFPHNRVRLLVWLFPFLMDRITVPARFVLGAYLLIDNLLPFLFSGQSGGVAYGAHIGGFVAGYVGARWLDHREASGGAYAPEPTGSYDPTAEAIEEAIAAGDMAGAAETYFRLPPQTTRKLLAPEPMLALAHWLQQQDHAQAALAVYLRFLRDHPRSPLAARAHLGAGQIRLEAFGQPAPAYQHFLDALDRDPDSVTASRAREGLEAIAAIEQARRRRRP